MGIFNNIPQEIGTKCKTAQSSRSKGSISRYFKIDGHQNTSGQVSRVTICFTRCSSKMGHQNPTRYSNQIRPRTLIPDFVLQAGKVKRVKNIGSRSGLCLDCVFSALPTTFLLLFIFLGSENFYQVCFNFYSITQKYYMILYHVA